MNDTCTVCGGLIYRSLTHRCPPKWHARLDWQQKGEERKVFASDAAQAAETFAARYDEQGDYTIIAEGEATVVVYDADMQLVGKFSIEAESRPVYCASAFRVSVEERKILAYEVENAESEAEDGTVTE